MIQITPPLPPHPTTQSPAPPPHPTPPKKEEEEEWKKSDTGWIKWPTVCKKDLSNKPIKFMMEIDFVK